MSSSPNVASNSRLHDFAKAGDYSAIEGIQEEGCIDISAVDRLGNSALYYACLNGHLSVVRLLVSLGARDDVHSRRCWLNSAIDRHLLPRELHPPRQPAIGSSIKANDMFDTSTGIQQTGESHRRSCEGDESPEKLSSSSTTRSSAAQPGCNKAVKENSFAAAETHLVVKRRRRPFGNLEERRAFLDSLCANPRLIQLDLRKCRMGAATGDFVHELVASGSPLRSVYLYQNGLGDGGARRLGQALSLPRGRCLEELVLCDNDIGPRGFWDLMAGLVKRREVCGGRDSGRLRVLDCNRNPITDTGVSQVASLLEESRTMEAGERPVEHLSLMTCGLTDSACVALSSLIGRGRLSSCVVQESLSVSKCGKVRALMNDMSAAALAQLQSVMAGSMWKHGETSATRHVEKSNHDQTMKGLFMPVVGCEFEDARIIGGFRKLGHT